VLQPNFRGSTGYGEKFVRASDGEWGGKMQTDLSDGVRFLAQQGIVDPKRVCIVGGSYGGYARSGRHHPGQGRLSLRRLGGRHRRPRKFLNDIALR
jgi:hypothetical protein